MNINEQNFRALRARTLSPQLCTPLSNFLDPPLGCTRKLEVGVREGIIPKAILSYYQQYRLSDPWDGLGRSHLQNLRCKSFRLMVLPLKSGQRIAQNDALKFRHTFAIGSTMQIFDKPQKITCHMTASNHQLVKVWR